MHTRNKLYLIESNLRRAGMLIKQANTYRDALTEEDLANLAEACAKLGEVVKSITSRVA